MSLSPATKAFVYTVIVAELFAVTYFGGTWLLTGSIIPHKEETKVLVAGADAAQEASGVAVAAAPAFDRASYTPDVGRGEKISAKCKACHSFDNGGPNRVGPNQWGVYGGKFGHASGFNYSSAIMEKHTAGAVWDEAALDGFLEAPRTYLPGNKMQFNGIKDPAERADLIAWLKTLK